MSQDVGKVEAQMDESPKLWLAELQDLTQFHHFGLVSITSCT